MHFLHSHLNNFFENYGDVNDKQGKKFHRDIKLMEERYQGRWDKRMMPDYCWGLKRDKPYNHLSEKSRERKFFWNNLHVIYCCSINIYCNISMTLR